MQNTPNYCISTEQGFPILWFSDRQHCAICGINNLIIRNTEFTIRCVVPFICFVFIMSICFSYCCRVGQRRDGRFSRSKMKAWIHRIRSNVTSERRLGSDLLKLHMLISRWIKHVCTFQYREHPCYTRDLANHSLLSKRLHRIGSRRLYCTTVTVYEEYFISRYHLDLFKQWPVHCAVTSLVLFDGHNNHGNWTATIKYVVPVLNYIVIQIKSYNSVTLCTLY